jgi:hypothetical protein
LPVSNLAPADERDQVGRVHGAPAGACADSMSLNAIATPAALEPGPLVTRWRRQSRRSTRVGRTKVDPVLGGEVVERRQHVEVLGNLSDRLGPLGGVEVRERWRVLTVDGYRAAGGVRGAVAQSVERLYEPLPEPQRMVLRSLLLRLVTLSPGGEPVATRITWDEVGSPPERRAVTDLLVRARLVTADEHSIVLAHEAVARAWPRLRSWLDDDVSGQQIMRHLALAAEDWNSRGRPDSELYCGGRLDAALDWRRRRAPDLTPVEDAYLDASAALVTSEGGRRPTRPRPDAAEPKAARSGGRNRRGPGVGAGRWCARSPAQP